MASIITATVASGLTQSADNSGVLQLASGTGNLVTVPSVTGTAMVSGNMPAFSAYNSVGQSISSATFTKVQFQTEEFDTANCFDSTTNYRFTPNVAGYYQINAAVNKTSSATEMQCLIYKNGSVYKSGNNGSTAYGESNSALVSMNGSTDYIEIYTYFGASGSTTSNVNGTWFQGVLVRAA